MRELFSSFYHKNLEVKSTKYGGSSITSSPGVFNFPELSTLGLQQFANYKAGFLPQHWFPQQILFFCLCSNKPGLAVVAFLIQKQWFAFWVHLFYEPRRVVDFSICSDYYLFLGWSISQLLTCGTRPIVYFDSELGLNWNIDAWVCQLTFSV